MLLGPFRFFGLLSLFPSLPHYTSKILLRGESGADSLKQVEEKLAELW